MMTTVLNLEMVVMASLATMDVMDEMDCLAPQDQQEGMERGGRKGTMERRDPQAQSVVVCSTPDGVEPPARRWRERNWSMLVGLEEVMAMRKEEEQIRSACQIHRSTTRTTHQVFKDIPICMERNMKTVVVGRYQIFSIKKHHVLSAMSQHEAR